jgi:hypothetical protein
MMRSGCERSLYTTTTTTTTTTHGVYNPDSLSLGRQAYSRSALSGDDVATALIEVYDILIVGFFSNILAI